MALFVAQPNTKVANRTLILKRGTFFTVAAPLCGYHKFASATISLLQCTVNNPNLALKAEGDVSKNRPILLANPETVFIVLY